VIERPIVVLVSLLEGGCCHADVVLYAAVLLVVMVALYTMTVFN
jgi:hypothetical protein